jgi:alkenylglycerophosphocholine/alkenylglycerophosphoethanolamine hydrolase
MLQGPTLLRIGLVAMATYMFAWLFDWPTLAMAAKPVPVLCLLGFLLPPRTADASLIGGGLLLSAIGDLLLEASPALFLPGLLSFLLAHVLYVAAFVGRTRALHLLRLVPVIAFSWLVYRWLAPHLGAMRLPVLVYVVVISAMLWRAAAQVGEDRTGALRPWLATSGAVLFALSDVMVAYTRFVDPASALKLPLMLLYWAGQAGIAASSRRS